MMNISKIISSRNCTRTILKKTLPAATKNYSTESEEKIEIPKYIARGPTDVLRALESTVGTDYTAAHYKYHDDPYLIPMSNVGKRTFAMAQEAGRKAAHWVRKENPELFRHDEADPPVEAFFPPMVYDEKTEVTENDLNKLIETAQVADAKLVYKLLKDKGVEVSADSEQKMLELFSFQNGEDAISEEFIEERWYRQSMNAKEKPRKTWKDGDYAEELFVGMNEPKAEAYCAIIQGMAKYLQVDRAFQLYEEARQKGLALNTNTYNALISVANSVKEHSDLRWELITSLLMEMKQNKLKPNLHTLNAVLQSLSMIGNNRMAKTNVTKTLAEFKALGIEPSLASWYYVLVTFCKERGPTSNVLYSILNELENKEHEIRSLKDTHFFVHAMEIARHHLKDVEAAKRVNELLHFGNNYDLIGDSYKESVYYRNYFALLCDSLPLNEFMNEYYEKLVPNIYVPEPGVMTEVLKQVDVNGAVEYTPKLWSDMIVFDQIHQEKLVTLLVDAMVNNLPTDGELKGQVANSAWDIFKRIEMKNEVRSNKFIFTGDLLGKILNIVSNGKMFDEACELMDYLDNNQHSVVGVPKIEALRAFIDLCIEKKAPSRAIACIQYCVDSGFPEAANLAQKVHEKLNLDEEFLARLSKVVGDVSLNKQTAETNV